ncbi:ABC transporter substrate-binding protein [Phytohabitans sp. ZYX-F-186]|uniref:Probable sugar-binding periplasmic protein n=1 Tax=Phytohabitans maris TaxID=3071409 RepID=A0ABU0ZHJ8_9ACTN|nr:ABC transporter substrate-binding protein [Phytohabitans sp. ZYX-F-186]MDQ7906521.1 ABC transporter substrate-binding protein [Phytohabitans sp. ZYX-F-186]
MRYSRRGIVALGLAAALIALPACSSSANDDDGGSSGSGDTEVEVFSWWAGPGEKEGLDAMIADFTTKNSGIKFNNAAVAGGAGTNAKTVLATRLQAKNPPDSYQVHAGLELASDIEAGYVEDITYLYDQQGWKEKFPKGLVDAITVDGKIYSVPVNIHRSNLLWFNPATLQKAGISAPPKTWAEFLTQAATLKSKGITALSIGPGWTQEHLLENVLLGELGTDKYTGLWNGSTDWKSAEVTAALTTYTKILGFSDLKSAAADWQPALDKVVDGTAAYNVMGDWADGYLKGAKALKFKTGYDVVATPGSEGVYNFLSDSFTLPVGAPHKGAAEKWLVECGSTEGQDAFNPQKGSVPARTDADKSKYTDYLAAALAEWQNPATKIVGSLAHGVVANNAFKGEIDTALQIFVQDGNVAKFADAVAKAYDANK